MKGIRRSLLLVAALLLVALPVLAACGGGGGNNGGGESSAGGEGGNKITITAESMAFDTDKIELKKGQTYTIELVNKDSVAHDFVAEELGLQVELTDPGQSKSIEFTPQQTGEFEFICSVPGHQATMNGTIVVTE
ncbi:MAG TPA: cupredoxin domain-containing protein [Thermaerobacter sp.]